MAIETEAGLEAIQSAIFKGDFREVKGLLDQGVDAEIRDELGEMPLMWAASVGSLEIAFLLIGEEVEIDARDNRRATPLMWAAANGRTDMVWLLVERGADIDAEEDTGETALSKAAVNGYFRIVRFLVGKKAKVKESDLLHVEDPEIIKFLRNALRGTNPKR